MKTATFTEKEVRQNAIKEMENCMAYLTIGDRMNATMAHGAAVVWEDMLWEVFDEELDNRDDEINEHYCDMVNIWCEAIKSW